MTTHYHAVLWIDHHEAKIIHFNADTAEETVVRASSDHGHLHHRTGSASGTHTRGDDPFFREVSQALASTQAFLLTGPSDAKTEFVKYLERHAVAIMAHLDSVETSARITDPQLLAHGRQHFKLTDRMTAQIPSQPLPKQ